MIYTVGKVEVYEPYLAERAEPRKLAGGSVWPTLEEASQYLLGEDPAGEYAVYGVLADWDTDTAPDLRSGQRFLTRDAQLVRLGEQR